MWCAQVGSGRPYIRFKKLGGSSSHGSRGRKEADDNQPAYIYTHPCFQRDNPDLLRKIVRKTACPKSVRKQNAAAARRKTSSRGVKGASSRRASSSQQLDQAVRKSGRRLASAAAAYTESARDSEETDNDDSPSDGGAETSETDVANVPTTAQRRGAEIPRLDSVSSIVDSHPSVTERLGPHGTRTPFGMDSAMTPKLIPGFSHSSGGASQHTHHLSSSLPGQVHSNVPPHARYSAAMGGAMSDSRHMPPPLPSPFTHGSVSGGSLSAEMNLTASVPSVKSNTAPQFVAGADVGERGGAIGQPAQALEQYLGSGIGPSRVDSPHIRVPGMRHDQGRAFASGQGLANASPNAFASAGSGGSWRPYAHEVDAVDLERRVDGLRHSMDIITGTLMDIISRLMPQVRGFLHTSRPVARHTQPVTHHTLLVARHTQPACHTYVKWPLYRSTWRYRPERLWFSPTSPLCTTIHHRVRRPTTCCRPLVPIPSSESNIPRKRLREASAKRAV